MSEKKTAGAIYKGEVVHKRVRPKVHSLRYSVFSMLVDVDRLDELAGKLRLFSHNRFNLFSFYDADFGSDGREPLADFIRRRAKSDGCKVEIARIEMLAYPRLLGYAFNPLTVFYLFDKRDELVMLFYEVHNTFGEKHFYHHLVEGAGDEITHENQKRFFVSPFNTLEGKYRFSLRKPGEDVFTGITLTTSQGPLLTAWFKGARNALSDASLAKLALEYPFVTTKIIVGIHWEALKLWLKGVPLTLHLRRNTNTEQSASK